MTSQRNGERTERRAAWVWGAGAFAATLALLGPAALGRSTAAADNPGAAAPDAAQVVRSFEPAIPGATIQPVGAQVDGAYVRASRNGGSVEVELRNPDGEARRVACTVVLEKVVHPAHSMLMRLVPEPEISRVLEQRVERVVEAGKTVTLIVPLPPGENIPEREAEPAVRAPRGGNAGLDEYETPARTTYRLVLE